MYNQFPTPKRYKGKIVEHTFVNPNTISLTIEMVEPNELIFLPGQFINLQVGPTTFRSYSIWSDASDHSKLSLVMTVAHVGVGSTFVKSLKVGDSVTLLGPSGRFVVNEDYSNEILIMVSGTGIAPTLSMLYRLAEINCTAKIRMCWGLKTEDWIFYTDKLEEFKKRLNNFDYLICLDGETKNWSGLRGRVTDYYKIDDASKVHVYICGNPFMCEAVLAKLKAEGVPDEHLYRENFTVAVKPPVTQDSTLPASPASSATSTSGRAS